jgi:hypothetical protein
MAAQPFAQHHHLDNCLYGLATVRLCVKNIAKRMKMIAFGGVFMTYCSWPMVSSFRMMSFSLPRSV